MNHGEKPYYEGFFQVVFTDFNIVVTPIDDELYHQLEGHCAEVNIPHHAEDAGYTMICMLTEVNVDFPAIWEMMQLKAIVAEFVTSRLEYFHLVSG